MPEKLQDELSLIEITEIDQYANIILGNNNSTGLIADTVDR